MKAHPPFSSLPLATALVKPPLPSKHRREKNEKVNAPKQKRIILTSMEPTATHSALFFFLATLLSLLAKPSTVVFLFLKEEEKEKGRGGEVDEQRFASRFGSTQPKNACGGDTMLAPCGCARPPAGMGMTNLCAQRVEGGAVLCCVCAARGERAEAVNASVSSSPRASSMTPSNHPA